MASFHARLANAKRVILQILPPPFRHQNLYTMSSTISRSPPLISSTASYAEDVACFILGKKEDLSCRTRFSEHRRAVIDNDANQPVACSHVSTGNHSVLIQKFETLSERQYPQKHEMCLISIIGTFHPYIGLMNVFPIFNSVCLFLSKADIDSTFNSYLIPYLSHYNLLHLLQFSVFLYQHTGCPKKNY